MDIFEQVVLNDCPVCAGAGLLEEEIGTGFYAVCMDCGSRTVTIDFKNQEGKLEAAKKVAMLWNTGKVVNSSPGE